MSRLQRILTDRGGMTLVEVLVAIGVITVGLLGVLAVAPMATSSVGEASLKTTATFLAQQRLEFMKNTRWSTCNASEAGCSTDLLGGEGAAGAAAVAPWPDEAYNNIVVGTADYPRFRRVTRITDCAVAACGDLAPAAAQTTLRQIAVTVFFLPITGSGQLGTAEESVTITTLVARRP
jgi:type IV pilus modification protein PilV